MLELECNHQPVSHLNHCWINAPLRIPVSYPYAASAGIVSGMLLYYYWLLHPC